MEMQPNHTQAILPELYSVSPNNAVDSLSINGKEYAFLMINIEDNISIEEMSTYLSTNFPDAIGYLKVLEKTYYIFLSETNVSQGTKFNSKLDIINLLTERELQVAQFVARGFSNKEIAKHLNISEWTISTHLRRIYVKLNVCNRAAMVHKCFGQ